MSEAWWIAGAVFVGWMIIPLLMEWIRESLLRGEGLPWRLLLKRAEEDPYFNREYARPKERQ